MAKAARGGYDGKGTLILKDIDALAQLIRSVTAEEWMLEAWVDYERELALVKVAGTGEDRIEALRLADVFRAKVVDTTIESFIFELTGTTEKVDNFVALMRQIGLVEVGRTGVVGLMRGKEAN